MKFNEGLALFLYFINTIHKMKYFNNMLLHKFTCKKISYLNLITKRKIKSNSL